MQYQNYLARGYMVGSGAIETQCKACLYKQSVERRPHRGVTYGSRTGALAGKNSRGGAEDPGLSELDMAHGSTELRLTGLGGVPSSWLTPFPQWLANADRSRRRSRPGLGCFAGPTRSTAGYLNGKR